jgi:hypothetical protein
VRMEKDKILPIKFARNDNWMVLMVQTGVLAETGRKSWD